MKGILSVLAHVAAEVALDLVIDQLDRARSWVRRPVTVRPARRAEAHAYVDGDPLPPPPPLPDCDHGRTGWCQRCQGCLCVLDRQCTRHQG